MSPRHTSVLRLAKRILTNLYLLCAKDVGGGAMSNDTPHMLSDISLRWMVREVAAAECGIQFDADALLRADIPMELGAPAANGEGDPATDDALQPLHDQLKLLPVWWLLEIIPLDYSWQDGAGRWHTTWGCVVVRILSYPRRY